MKNTKDKNLDIKRIRKNFGEKSLDKYFDDVNDKVKYMAVVKTYLFNLSTIPNIIKIVDSIIESRAMSSFDNVCLNGGRSTLSEMEKLIDMTERKKRLLAIQNVMTIMVGCLTPEEKKFAFDRFSKQKNVKYLSEKYNIPVRSVYRKINAIVLKIIVRLMKLEVSYKYFEKQMKCEDWLRHYFNQIYDKQLKDEKRKVLKIEKIS